MKREVLLLNSCEQIFKNHIMEKRQLDFAFGESDETAHPIQKNTHDKDGDW